MTRFGVAFACVLLATPASAIPLQNTDWGQLLLDMSWEVGEFGDTINIQFGADDHDGGFLKVSETTGPLQLLEGYVGLTPDNVKELLTLEKNSNFLSMAPSGKPLPDKDEQGNEFVRIGCYDLSISELHQNNYETSHNVRRPCAIVEPALLNYAKALVRLAQRHFPDLASRRGWIETLKEEQ